MSISDSTGANQFQVQLLYAGGIGIRWTKTIATAFSSGTAQLLTGTGDLPIFMHIQRATNNWQAWWSNDAVHWKQIGTAQAVTMTVNKINLNFGPGGAAAKTHVTLHWFRRDWLTL